VLDKCPTHGCDYELNTLDWHGHSPVICPVCDEENEKFMSGIATMFFVVCGLVVCVGILAEMKP
jgi:hypothetical protein